MTVEVHVFLQHQRNLKSHEWECSDVQMCKLHYWIPSPDPCCRLSPFRRFIIALHPQVDLCALSQSTQVNCSALLVLWCIILFPFTLCVWSDSQRKQKLKSLWEKSPEQRIFGQFNLNRPAALLKYTPPAFFLPIFLVDDKNCRSQ